MSPAAPPQITYEPIPRMVARANPFRFVPELWQQRQLIRQLAWREVTGRYRTSILGLAWSFVTPLVQLALYTFVFGVVLKTRWGGGNQPLSEFGLMLFAGIAAFGVFTECMTRAPGLIVASPNYVKKVVFPLEILPVAVLLSALFHGTVSLALLFVARAFLISAPLWTVVFLPIVLVPLVLSALGISWILASLGVFLRDLHHAVGLATQVLMFATPIFYPPSLFPSQFLLQLNPLASTVDNMRRIMVQGLTPDWEGWGYATIIGVGLVCFGYAWFVKSKRAFADVI
jgi:lipopolysaccharide transport system permease protein